MLTTQLNTNYPYMKIFNPLIINLLIVQSRYNLVPYPIRTIQQSLSSSGAIVGLLNELILAANKNSRIDVNLFVFLFVAIWRFLHNGNESQKPKSLPAPLLVCPASCSLWLCASHPLRYLQRVVTHPSLLQDPDVREFLEREEVRERHPFGRRPLAFPPQRVASRSRFCLRVICSCQEPWALRPWAAPASWKWSTKQQTPSAKWPSRWTSQTWWVHACGNRRALWQPGADGHIWSIS